MFSLLRYWPFSRMANLTLVSPLAVICIFSAIVLMRGNTYIGSRMLFLGAGGGVVFYSIGRMGFGLSDAISSPRARRLVQGSISATVALATWTCAWLAIFVIPGMQYADPRRYGPSPDEAVPRTVLKQLGAELTLGGRGHIIDVRLHDVSNEALSALHGLRFVSGLNMEGLRVTDRDMAQFSDLHTLDHLNLERTGVTDECLRWLSGFSRLRTLNLSDTRITDIGLTQVTPLRNLTGLWLSGTKVSDSGMSQLGKLHELQWLHLDRTAIDDKGLRELKQLHELTELYLEQTGIRDDALVTVGSFMTLRQLDLSNTAVTDAGVVNLASLKALWNLNLTGTQITDAGLLRLDGLKGLRVLSVHATRVTASGVDAFLKSVRECRVFFGPEKYPAAGR